MAGPFDDLPPLQAPLDSPDAWSYGAGDDLPEATPALIRATPYVWRSPEKIPPREWLYNRHLIRRFLSTTVAPGAAGKTSLLLVEAIAMVTGRALLGPAPARALRVWYWNGEDPLEEVERRVAAICLHYGIEPAEIEGRLFLDTGRESEIVLAVNSKDGARIAHPVVAALGRTIAENRIDVVIIDPFVSSHRIGENDNGAVDLVATTWNRIAEAGRCAIELVHHVRKGMGGEHTVEDGRGAGALLAKARSARVLNPMTKEEAERAGEASHRGHFRVDNGKANLAPPPERSDWFRLVSVSLRNGPDGLEAGSDHVAVVEAWEWPDTMADVSVDDLRRAQRAVAAGQWRESAQAKEWAGKPIAEALGIELDRRGRAKVKRLLKVWLDTGMFVVVEGQDDKRNKRSFIEVGETASD